MGNPTREQVYDALVEGWHRCPDTAPSTLDGMTDAVMALLAAHDHRLCGCGDELSALTGALCGNCQAALGLPSPDHDHRVLWEGETRKSYELSEGCDSYIAPPSFAVPPGTRVQVVVTRPDTEEESDGR